MTSTILWTEFLLQFRKQREDSAILLASNKPHNKEKTKKQRKTEREKNREGLRTSGLTEIIQKETHHSVCRKCGHILNLAKPNISKIQNPTEKGKSFDHDIRWILTKSWTQELPVQFLWNLLLQLLSHALSLVHAEPDLWLTPPSHWLIFPPSLCPDLCLALAPGFDLFHPSEVTNPTHPHCFSNW